MPAITARTRIVFMIGTPIAQAKSPDLFNAHFAATGQDRVMVALDVSAAALPAFVATVRDAANCDGFVSTLPHKQALLALVDEASPAAIALDAVNVVRREPDGRLIGGMTDGAGFWNGVEAAGFDPRNAAVALAGAGAAATAIAVEFAARGGGRLAVWSRDEAETDTLAARLKDTPLQIETAQPTSLAGFSLAINATPLGMAYAPGSAFSRDLLATMPASSFAADAITDPLDTAFLVAARALGHTTVNGAAMTKGQFDQLRAVLGV